MECPSIPFPLPFESARRSRAYTLAGGLALVLLAAPMAIPSAQAEPLKEIGSSFDEAGRALNRQIGDWVGTPQKPRTPAKKRAQPANAKANDAKSSAAKSAATNSTAAKPAPLPPSKPADATESAEAPTPPANPENVTSNELPPASAASTAAAEPTPTPAEPAAKPPPQVAARSVAEPAETAATKPVPLPPTRTAEPQAPRETAAAPAETAPAEAPASEKPPTEQRVAAIPAPPPAPAQPAAPAPQAMATICPELSNDDLGKFEPYVVTATNPLCTVDRGVSLSAVRMKDGRMVELAPAAVLRCEMAASVAHWLREKVDPAVATLGSPLDKVMVAASQQCRPRNRVAGAKISEHGRGNALDTHGYALKDGRRFVIGKPNGKGEEAMPVAFQEKLKLSACADFTTILGPGSDGYHEQHLHVDRAQRRSGAVLCQWSTANVTAKVPKPPAKPADISTEAPAANPADEVDEEEGPGEGPAVTAP